MDYKIKLLLIRASATPQHKISVFFLVVQLVDLCHVKFVIFCSVTTALSDNISEATDISSVFRHHPIFT